MTNDLVLEGGGLDFKVSHIHYTSRRERVITNVTEDFFRGMIAGISCYINLHESKPLVFELENENISKDISLVLYVNCFKDKTFVSVCESAGTIDCGFTDTDYENINNKLNSLLKGVVVYDNQES